MNKEDNADRGSDVCNEAPLLLGDAAQDVFDAVAYGLFIIDLTGCYRYVNPAGVAMSGYTREEILSSCVSLLCFPEDAPAAFERYRAEWIKGAVIPEYRLRKKDGSEIWVELTMNPFKFKGEDLCLCIKRDITAFRRSAMDIQTTITARTEELKKANDLLFAIMDNSNAIIFLKDADGRFSFVNRQYELLFKTTRDEVRGRSDYDLFPVEFADRLREHDELVLEANAPMEFEEDILHPDGSVHTYIVLKFTIPTMPGSVCGIATNITARKTAEDAVKRSEELLNSAQEIAGLGSWNWDIAKDRLTWSDEIYRIFGVAPKSVGATYEAFMDFVHPDDKEFVKKSIYGALYSKKPYLIEHRIVKPDKAVRTVRGQGEVKFDMDGKPCSMVGTIHDITDYKRLEGEILNVQKLETVGALAGGIAHDFNNLLLGILGSVSIVKAQIKPGDKGFNMLDNIEKTALRAKNLTRQFLTFSRGGEPIREDASIEEIVRTTAGLVLKGTGINAYISFPSDLMRVKIDEGQIAQVINNIILNAVHAMPEGGRLDITGENSVVSKDSHLPLPHGDYVRIRVKDSGSGIAKENISRVFDPFFTTKAKASGLGLTVSFSIIKKHGGHITVESTDGAGAAFSIYLPSVQKEAMMTGIEAEGRSNGGKVLVMDDEEIVRDVSGEMLEILGYKADFAVDGAEAIKKYAEAMDRGEPFSAVIMDLTIPGGMGGVDVVKKLREMHPGIKAIVSSGYSNDPIMSDYRHYGFCAVIAKPYRVSEFGKVIKGVLSGKP